MRGGEGRDGEGCGGMGRDGEGWVGWGGTIREVSKHLFRVSIQAVHEKQVLKLRGTFWRNHGKKMFQP